MGFVAVTVGFAALGAYLGRDLSGATGLVLFICAFACIFGLNAAAARGREQLAIGLLFGLGLLLGLAVAPVIADYAKTDPSALWQAAGATAACVAATSTAAPSKCRHRRRDRRQHLPRRLQRLPAVARPVRRRAGLAT
jgi:FtsH-binding integral membrane protein